MVGNLRRRGIRFKEGGSDKNFWIVKFDKDGKTIWQKNYGDSSAEEIAKKIVALSGGDLAVVGNKKSSGGGGYVMRLKGSDGTQKWEKTFGGNQADKFNDVEIRGNGNLLIAGAKVKPATNVNKKGGGTKWATHTDGWILEITPGNGTQIRQYYDKGSVSTVVGGCGRYDGDDEIHKILISEKVQKAYLKTKPAKRGGWVLAGETSSGCYGGVNGSGTKISTFGEPDGKEIEAENEVGGAAYALIELKGNDPNIGKYIVVGESKGSDKEAVVYLLTNERMQYDDPLENSVYFDFDRKKKEVIGGTGDDYITDVIQDKNGDPRRRRLHRNTRHQLRI